MIRPFNYMIDYNQPSPYIDEIWVPLNWNDHILDRYNVSSFGRLYDNRDSKYIKYSTDKDGYFMASIKVEGVGYKKIRVHRFELLSFNYNPNYINLQVNHKDGNKQNLFIYNLEWITPLGNTRHGWDHHMNNNIGITNGNGKYSDDIIHKICELLDNGYTNAQVCDRFHISDKDERMRFSATVSGIKLGKTHRYISNQYSFMNSIRNSNRYGLEFAELCCQFLISGQYTYKQIMDYLDIPNNERVNFKIYLDDLVRGRTTKSVTSKYELKKPINDSNDFSYLMR